MTVAGSKLDVILSKLFYCEMKLSEFNDMIEAGDLAFFSKDNEPISHVGICLNKEQIIHASGKVRIDKLDHHGIFNVDNQSYSHNLRIVKRIKKAVD